MGDLYEPLSKLPKNIRQIGDRDDTVKLYMEDYVSTYLKRLFPTGGQDLRVGLLLGTEKTEDGTPFIFVDGALEMEDVTADGEKVVFTEAAWKKAYQNIEESFPRRTVQGWFLCGAPGCALSPLNYWKQHGQYFSEKNQLMYLNSGIEGDESIYITSDDGFYRLKGYCIYYDRNQMMQDYMICRKDVKRVESGAGDRVIRDFRERMEDRKKEVMSQRHTVRNLGLVCSTMSLVILAGGVVMLNNYQKMQEMETALVSVLPEGARPWDKEDSREESVPVVVEEIKGNVYPKETDSQSQSAENGAQSGQFSAGTLYLEDTAQSAGTGEAGKLSSEKAPEGNQEEGGNSSAGETGQEVSSQGAGQAGTVQSGQTAKTESGKSEAEAGAESGEKPETENQETEPESEEAGDVGNDRKDSTADSQPDAEASESLVPVTDMKPGAKYLVGEGETLYGICFKLYGNINYVKDICALNGVSDINHIMAGQKLILPAEVPVLEEMKGAVEE